MSKKTAVEILYNDYIQSEEYLTAARAIERKYEPKYERFMEAMNPEARDEFEETISNNCDDCCLLGFKLGMAVTLNIKAEADTLYCSELINNERYIENDTYYSFDSSGEIIELMHENNMWDLMVAALGIGYGSPEDAREHEAEALEKLSLTTWPLKLKSGGVA